MHDLLKRLQLRVVKQVVQVPQNTQFQRIKLFQPVCVCEYR